MSSGDKTVATEEKWNQTIPKDRGSFPRKQIGPSYTFSLVCLIATSASSCGLSGPVI